MAILTDNIWDNVNNLIRFIEKYNHHEKLSIYLIHNRCMKLYLKTPSHYWMNLENGYIEIIKNASLDSILKIKCLNNTDFHKIKNCANMIDWWYLLKNNNNSLYNSLINNIDSILMIIILKIIDTVIHINQKINNDLYEYCIVTGAKS